MKINRKQFIQGLAASSVYMKFNPLAFASSASNRRKILFVYAPTGTTHKFFPDDITNLKNRWTDSWETTLSDSHFNSTISALKPLKDKIILFHGLSPYGNAPTNHFEIQKGPNQGAGDGGGPSTVFTGGGGYSHGSTSPLLSERKMLSLDQHFIKKGKMQGIGNFQIGVHCESSEGGKHISFNSEKPILISEPKRAIASYNEYLCKSLGSCAKAVGAIDKKVLLDKIINDNTNHPYKNENLFAKYIKALEDAKLAGDAKGEASLTCDAKLTEATSEDDSYKQANQAKDAIVSAFKCGAEVGVLQFGTGHVGGQRWLFACEHHHHDSHFLENGFESMKMFEKTHKEIIEYVAKIAEAPIKEGKKFCDDVLIVVSSCLGEIPSLHSGNNIPCLLIGGDSSILKHGKYYNYLWNSGKKPSGLVVETNNYTKIKANYGKRVVPLEPKKGGYNKFLNSICYYMGYPPKDESIFVHGDVFGFLDKSQKKPAGIDGPLDIFKKDKNSIGKNWG